MEVFELLINSALLTALLTALAIIGGAVATIIYTNWRERDRMEHERSMRLRDERIGAYRRLLAAATTAHMEREAVNDLAAAHAEISLLSGSPELTRAARAVWQGFADIRRTADEAKKDPVNTTAGDFEGDFEKALNKALIAREEFLELARKELGVDP